MEEAERRDRDIGEAESLVEAARERIAMTDEHLLREALEALKFCRSVLEANPVEMSERMAIEKASKAIEEAQS